MKLRLNSYFPKRDYMGTWMTTFNLLPRVEYIKGGFHTFELAVGWLFWEVWLVGKERR